MKLLLASLLLLAADPKPAGPPPVPDSEVPAYLSRTELPLWNNAVAQVAAGEERIRKGNSIVASAAIKRSTLGAFAETPEQIKLRGQKLVAEGQEIVRKSEPTLARLRLLAAAKKAEILKPVVHQLEIPRQPWPIAVSLSAVRMQKAAREAGFQEIHFLGAATYIEGKPSRSDLLGGLIRSAWEKAEAGSLQAVPVGGYSYARPSDGSRAPSFTAKRPPAKEQKKTAVVWAELFPLSSDASAGLLFLRMADAYTALVVASECSLTTVGPSETSFRELSGRLSLADSQSFLPRLASSGAWILSYDPSSPPLGVALLRHLCVKDGRVLVGASAPIAAVIGGDLPADDGAHALWSISAGSSSGLSSQFRVSGGSGQERVAVGDLDLRVTEPAPVKK